MENGGIPGTGRWSWSRHGIVLGAFLAVGGYFLWVEHEAHVVLAASYWPWLLLALCPLLHMFMHGGHGGHRHGRSTSDREPE